MGKCVGGKCFAFDVVNLWEAEQRSRNIIETATTAIDPMPLPTGQRRDDIAVEACNIVSLG